MISYNTLETLTVCRLEDVEREWKMAALAAQLPPRSHSALSDRLARGLCALAARLDPDLAGASDSPAAHAA